MTNRWNTDSDAGFSLIELIVSLAIIGLLIVSFFPVIANGFYGIRSAGNNGQMLYQLQQQAESSLLVVPTQVNHTMTFHFSDAGQSLSIAGEKQEFNSSLPTFPFQITIFKPLD